MMKFHGQNGFMLRFLFLFIVMLSYKNTSLSPPCSNDHNGIANPQQEQIISHPHLPKENNLQQNEEKIKKYFHSIKKQQTNKIAQIFNRQVQQLVQSRIQEGEMNISEEQRSVDRILEEEKLKQQKLTRQNKQKNDRKFIQMNLKYLSSQIVISTQRTRSRQNEGDNQFITETQSNPIILSKEEHKEFVTKMIRQRSELSLRKKKYEEKEKSKIEEQQKLRKMASQQFAKQNKEQKKKKHISKIEEQKQNQEQKMKMEQQNNRRLSEVKNRKLLYKQLQNKYNTEILIPSLEERKKKLKEIREMNKGYSAEDIKNHEKEYLKQKEEILATSQAKRSKQTWHYEIPQKPQKLVKLLEEESLQEKVKIEEKKRKVQEKIMKQQQFIQYLKQNHVPTIDPRKRLEIQERIRLKSEQKQIVDGRTLGLSYLEQIKSQRKRSANSQMQLEKNEAALEETKTQITKKVYTNYLQTHKNRPTNDISPQKRIEKIMNSTNTGKVQKIMKLQMESERLLDIQKKMDEKNKVKKSARSKLKETDESTNLLLASIKAKMGIIQIYNNA